jgi:hypothetical protein
MLLAPGCLSQSPAGGGGEKTGSKVGEQCKEFSARNNLKKYGTVTWYKFSSSNYNILVYCVISNRTHVSRYGTVPFIV